MQARNLKLILVSFALLFAVGSCADRSGGKAPSVEVAQSTPTFGCGTLTVPIGPGVPGDAPIFANQTNADCFAWWEFISLNWPAQPGQPGVANTSATVQDFGKPRDLSPVVWETYIDPSLLFPGDGAAPPAFGTQPKIPSSCESEPGLTAGHGQRPMTMTSKFDIEFLPSAVQEAAPHKIPNWLGAQNGANVWYEVRINKDEYDYVTDTSHQFYNADNQSSWVNDGNPITLPQGVYQGQTGAIELKAAWMEVPNPSDSKWTQYKLASAVIVDPTTNRCRTATVALVGLHILHLTVQQNTWVWATFEHKDNVPDPSDGGSPPAGGYNFNNPDCQPQKITVSDSSCLPEGTTSPVTVTCTPNHSPPYFLGPTCPGPVPIQVTRANGNSRVAQQVNPIAHQAINQAFPDSVWQYYELVNVIWSTSTTSNPTSPVKVPESVRGMTSDQMNAANTTMETYAQDNTCTDCHRYATIAPTAKHKNPDWASDFTFMLGRASYPPSGAKR